MIYYVFSGMSVGEIIKYAMSIFFGSSLFGTKIDKSYNKDDKVIKRKYDCFNLNDVISILFIKQLCIKN